MNLKRAISIADGLDAVMPELAELLDRLLLRGKDAFPIRSIPTLRSELMRALIGPDTAAALVSFSSEFSPSPNAFENRLTADERRLAVRGGLGSFTPTQLAALVRDSRSLLDIHLSAAHAGERDAASPWAPYYRSWINDELRQEAFRIGSERLMRAITAELPSAVR